MNDFLPMGTKVPESQSNYFKFKKGKNKFRAVGSAVVGYEYWNTENKPVRLKEYPQSIPSDIRVEESGKVSEVKYFWAFPVLDRADNTIKLIEITQKGILRDLESLITNEDWGTPKEYDVTVERSGDGLKTEYTVNPSPHKPLTDQEKQLIANTKVNTEALFSGGDPFDTVKEEVTEVPLEPQQYTQVEDGVKIPADINL